MHYPDPRRVIRRLIACCCLGLASLLSGTPGARASDHLDSPSVIADNRADIGDLYAWMDPGGRHLNLVMTLVGHGFSDRLDYVFHIDSSRQLGPARATVRITCRFRSLEHAECEAGGLDHAQGDPRDENGLWSSGRRFRVFAGLRDDPFYNNVKGTRAAYLVADAALKAGAARDAAGCPRFDADTSRDILAQWRQTEDRAAQNFLAGWTSAAIVIQIDRMAVARGGKLLAVWAATVAPDGQIDRAGRTLTGNALLGNFEDQETRDRLKERYNAATPATAADFAPEIAKALGLYDAFDGQCGNQLLALAEATGPDRYRSLAQLLADDRLWINSASSRCGQPFAVELALADDRTAFRRDCGGRTPTDDAVDVYRSLLVDGSSDSIEDGVGADDRNHSISRFPFLAAPASNGYPDWTP